LENQTGRKWTLLGKNTEQNSSLQIQSLPETYTALIFYGYIDYFGKVLFEILIKNSPKIKKYLFKI